jgi:hypothetical protein
LLREFAATLPERAVVYDIGKSRSHDYRETFQRQTYLTVDRDSRKRPGILLNLETASTKCTPCDALLCNGVLETCDDPCALLSGCRRLLALNGVALFGIMSAGYPVGTRSDYWRLTPAGALRLLDRTGFTELRADPILRFGIPSYLYVFARAK